MIYVLFFEENNYVLSIFGISIIEIFVFFRYFFDDIDIFLKVLNSKLAEILNVGFCVVDGTRLGLYKVVRVFRKINCIVFVIVCGVFRVIFGAVVIDIGKVDDVVKVFWNVYFCYGGIIVVVL